MMDMTPHKWQKIDDRFVFALNEEGVNEFDFFINAKDPSKAAKVATLACAAPALLEALELAKKIIEEQATIIDSLTGDGLSFDKLLQNGDAPEGYSTIIAAIAAAKGE